MKTNNMNLPANCSVITDDEMLHIGGGFKIGELEISAPIIAVGAAAVVTVGAMAVNMLRWFTGNRETNFIQDAMNAGANFINGSLNIGHNILNGLLGK